VTGFKGERVPVLAAVVGNFLWSRYRIVGSELNFVPPRGRGFSYLVSIMGCYLGRQHFVLASVAQALHS
jgi:hypothetical protein